MQETSTTQTTVTTGAQHIPVFRNGKSSSYFPNKAWWPYGGDNPVVGGEFWSSGLK